MDEVAQDPRLATALHESAHLIAGIARLAFVYEVELCRPGRRRRTGAEGSVGMVLQMPEDDAFCSLVGYAWEEKYGAIDCGSADLHDGRRHAHDSDRTVEDLLEEARRFVVKAEPLIRSAAAVVLKVVPASGVLKSRKLEGVLAWLRPQVDALRAK